METNRVLDVIEQQLGCDPDTSGGWIRAQLAFDIAGFGLIEMHARLGLTSAGLEGLLYARHPTGELSIPAGLTREGAPPVPAPGDSEVTLHNEDYRR